MAGVFTNRSRRLTLTVLSLSLVLLGCSRERKGHQAMGRDFEPLRSAFNADVGKVRVLMLLSPT